jgi:hypothetical protein
MIIRHIIFVVKDVKEFSKGSPINTIKNEFTDNLIFR